MANYIIEDDIDFYKEIHEDQSNNIHTSFSKGEQVCLISNEPLTKYSITLLCGHSFNYIPLYNDLVQYKIQYNKMKKNTNTNIHDDLHVNEIRCPYCRKTQSVLIPYYSGIGCKKVLGVNSYKNISGPYHSKCEYKIINKCYDPTIPESGINIKYSICGVHGASIIKIYNQENPLEPTNYGDNGLYCCNHKKQMINYYKKIEKQKEKQREKQQEKIARQLEKQELKKKQKEEMLAKKRMEKELKKQSKKTVGAKCEDLIMENNIQNM